jgi:hypothetical protein
VVAGSSRRSAIRRQFVGADAGGEVGVSGVRREVRLVEPRQELAAGPVGVRGQPRGPGEVRDRLVGVEGRALEHGRQERALPLPRADLRPAAGIGDRHECRQVVAFAPQGVGRPGAHAGKAVEREPGGHLVLGRAVGVALGRHRVDEAHLVGEVAEHRQEVARHLAALAARLELPLRLDEVALFPLERDHLLAAGRRHRGVVAPDELGLVVERVHV